MKFIMSGVILLGTLLSVFFINFPIVSRQDTGYSRIQRKAFFEQLSVKYYGTPNYYRQLDAVNRKLNFNQLHKHTDIIVPTLNAIQKSYYKNSRQTQRNMKKDDDHQSTIWRTSPFYSSLAHTYIGIIFVVALALGFLLGRIKIRKNDDSNNVLSYFNKKKDNDDVEIIRNRDEFLIHYKINKS